MGATEKNCYHVIFDNGHVEKNISSSLLVRASMLMDKMKNWPELMREANMSYIAAQSKNADEIPTQSQTLPPHVNKDAYKFVEYFKSTPTDKKKAAALSVISPSGKHTYAASPSQSEETAASPSQLEYMALSPTEHDVSVAAAVGTVSFVFVDCVYIGFVLNCVCSQSRLVQCLLCAPQEATLFVATMIQTTSIQMMMMMILE